MSVKDIPLKPWETRLWELGRDLGITDLDGGIFAASRVSNLTNDGQILEQ